MATCSFNILSKTIGRHVTINAFIPTLTANDVLEGKNPYSHQKKLKVLWLLHGFAGNQEDYFLYTNIARYAQSKNLAVIMPPAFNGGYSDLAAAEKYMSFVAHELVEACAYLFPISTKQEDMKLGGLSMGAMGAMKIAMTHPQQYSEVLCMSGVPYRADEEIQQLHWFGQDDSAFQGTIPGQGSQIKGTLDDAYYYACKNHQENTKMPRFYLTVGTNDFFLSKCQSAYSYLKDLSIDITYSELEGFGHEWDFWDKQLRYAIENWFML